MSTTITIDRFKHPRGWCRTCRKSRKVNDGACAFCCGTNLYRRKAHYRVMMESNRAFMSIAFTRRRDIRVEAAVLGWLNQAEVGA